MEKINTKYDLSTVQGFKDYLYKMIDNKTGELISLGFTYATKVFSLSANAQSNLLGVYTSKDLLSYPFAWNVKDDSETYDIADATEMATFFMTALTYKKTQQDSGTALKTQVTACNTIAELELIEDNR
jgi:hypothetical protein